MRREYNGAAQAAALTVALGGSTGDLTITCDDLTGWPTGVSYPFYIVIDRGTPSEEKILCSSRTGNVLSVYNVGGTVGRGADDTSITSHNTNAVVEHVFTATDADEANAHVNSSTGTVHGLELAKVVTTDGTQTLTNKTLSNATVSGTLTGSITMTSGTITGATSVSAGSVSASSVSAGSVSVTGAQTLADFRARNVYAATAAPTAGAGNDGDLWVQYES